MTEEERQTSFIDKVGLTIIFIILAVGVAVLVHGCSNDKFVREAVKRGHAHYKVDAYGYPEFEWNIPCNKLAP